MHIYSQTKHVDTSRVAKEILVSTFLLLGPITSYSLIRPYINSKEDLSGVCVALFLIWSPLFLSVPALILQRARDLALPHEASRVLRGVKLVPYMLLSKSSSVRLETFASIVGWLFLTIALGPSILNGLASISRHLL